MARRIDRIRLLAWLLAGLAVIVVAVSAWVRLSAAGLGCADWPACYGALLADGSTPHVGLVRLVHRIAASAALLLAFVTLWHCLRPTPIQPAARLATLLLVLMLALAVIGLWSANPQRALPVFVNILGGLGLVSLAWRLLLATGEAPAATPADTTLRAGIACLAAVMALGALIGARYAAIACPTVPFCPDSNLPSAAGIAALNPFVLVTKAMTVGDAGGVALHLLHRYCALAAVVLLGAAAVRALGDSCRRRNAQWLLAVLVAETLLGGATVASGYALPIAVAHSVGAALLLALAAQLARRQ